MPRRKTSIDCNHLLNFKHNLSPDLQSSSSLTSNQSTTRRGKNSFHHNKHHAKKYDPKKQAAQRAEKNMRQKLNSSFYLHSSALHSFVVTRSKVDKQKGEDRPMYLRNPSGGGGGSTSTTCSTGKNKRHNDADCVVNWDIVRMVKVLIPIDDETTPQNDNNDHAVSTCSICLDTCVSPRITKCGHIYCLPCILRHFHICDNNQREKHSVKPYQSQSRDSVAKCPCCYNYIQLSEMRPVHFIIVQSTNNKSAATSSSKKLTMTFQKLHRKRDGLIPFLPFQKESLLVSNSSNGNHLQPKRVSIRKRVDPNDLPDMYDLDAPYCRFNYLDMPMYIQHLENDLSSLQIEMQTITELYKNFKGKNVGSGDLDRYFITMAIEVVQVEHRSALTQLDEQTILKKEQEAKILSTYITYVVPYSAAKFINCDKNTSDNLDYGNSSTVVYNSSVQREQGDNKTSKLKRRPRSHSMHLEPGTMFLDDDDVHFYQASDGQLNFLCSFNLKCLAYEFMDKQSNTMQLQTSSRKISEENYDKDIVEENRPPFPDVIQGQIIDIQSIHLTPEVRNRMAFTSHLPLYIDINLVELNLTQYLSHKTRDHFRHELEQRKKKRQSQRNAERRAKKMAEKEESDRIENLKKGIQSIDFNDDFFHSIRPSNEDETDFVGEAFGPALSMMQQVPPCPNYDEVSLKNNHAHRSYGSVCASNGFFPNLDSSNCEAFPFLSSASSSDHSHVNDKGNTKMNTLVSPNASKAQSIPTKSTKKNKVVLFSTGGRRSYGK